VVCKNKIKIRIDDQRCNWFQLQCCMHKYGFWREYRMYEDNNDSNRNAIQDLYFLNTAFWAGTVYHMYEDNNYLTRNAIQELYFFLRWSTFHLVSTSMLYAQIRFFEQVRFWREYHMYEDNDDSIRLVTPYKTYSSFCDDQCCNWFQLQCCMQWREYHSMYYFTSYRVRGALVEPVPAPTTRLGCIIREKPGAN
jgi:hypothetical protein